MSGSSSDNEIRRGSVDQKSPLSSRPGSPESPSGDSKKDAEMDGPVTLMSGLQMARDIDQMDMKSLNRLQEKLSGDFKLLTQEYIAARIKRAEEYSKVIRSLKQQVQEHQEQFNEQFMKLQPTKNNGVEMPNRFSSSPILEYPVVPTLPESTVFTDNFEETLGPYYKKLRLLYAKYRYDFHNTERAKYANIQIIWQRYLDSRKRAKEHTIEQIESEIDRLEHALYNVAPNESKQLQKTARSVGSNERFSVNETDVALYNSQIQQLHLNYLHSINTSQPPLAPADENTSFEDLYKIKLLTQDQNNISQKHRQFLVSVLDKIQPAKPIPETKSTLRLPSLSLLLSNEPPYKRSFGDSDFSHKGQKL